MTFIIIALLIAIAAVVILSRGDNPEEQERTGNIDSNDSYELNVDEPTQNTATTLREQYGMIVWLDAGHGGIDGGTSGTLNDVTHLEKDLTLDIVLMVHEMFENSNSGVKAFLSRSYDETIRPENRPLRWNDSADLVVSVHIDYYEGPTAQQVTGVQVLFADSEDNCTSRVNITSRQFAQVVQDHLVAETAARDRGIRNVYNLIIGTHSSMPVVLIESGFMSNQEELALLVTREYQMTIATAIYNAIVEAFSFPHRN